MIHMDLSEVGHWDEESNSPLDHMAGTSVKTLCRIVSILTDLLFVKLIFERAGSKVDAVHAFSGDGKRYSI